MKKRLNEDQIVNELRGNSAYFTAPPAESTSIYAPNERTDTPYDRTDEAHVRSYDRTPRRTKRHSFEIYEDQLQSLRRLSAQATLDGQPQSMSEMVRTALDHFLKTQT